jgi:hypothetical protein
MPLGACAMVVSSEMRDQLYCSEDISGKTVLQRSRFLITVFAILNTPLRFKVNLLFES